MFNVYKYASRNRGKFYRRIRRKSGYGRKIKRPIVPVPGPSKASVSSPIVYRGNLRSVSDKRKRLDYGHASKKFMKLGTTVGVVGRGVYSMARSYVNKRYRGYRDDTEYVLPMFDTGEY